MNTMRFVCGSCDYSTDLTEKLKSHYMAIHQLSVGDASVMVRSNVGDLLESREWYERFKEDFETNSANPWTGTEELIVGRGSDGLQAVIANRALQAAKRAAGLEGVK